MLNFTTTTLVNSGDSVYANASKKLFRVKFGPELFNDGTIHKATLVKKQAYTAAQLAKATVVLPASSATGVYRIAIYIRLRNNQNEYFSNDWTFKGKPLYIEFNGGDSADDIVTIAKKYMLAQYGYNLVKISAVAGEEETDPKNLVIEAVNQWEMFMDQDANNGVKVEKLTLVNTSGKEVNDNYTALPTHEEFVPVASTVASVTVDNGNEAFGDFAHIVKDLRLPSAANLRWQGIAQGDIMDGEPNDDKPLPTGHYTQYTIQYDSERGVIGGAALGSIATSRTTHVFYVESGAVTAFETALTTSTIGTTAGTAKLI